MAYELSFSPEFFSSEDEIDKERPFTVMQAVEAMDPGSWAELAKEVFDCDPEHLAASTVMDKIHETNTCGTLSSPVDVWIDPEGYFRVNVYDAPRHAGSKGLPLCGNERQGELAMEPGLVNCTACVAIGEWVDLIDELKENIGDEYRVEGQDEDDETPTMSVTVGYTPRTPVTKWSWGYQTGDNSFTGGAYSHPHWAVVELTRDSNPEEVAKEIWEQISELLAN